MNISARAAFPAPEKARAMIRVRRGDEFVSPAISNLLISWRSFHDMANPDGDYNVFPFLEVMRNVRLSRRPRFGHLRANRKPTLVLYGNRDEYCYGDVSRCVAILSGVLTSRPNFELAILANNRPQLLRAGGGGGGRDSRVERRSPAGWPGAVPAPPVKRLHAT